MGRTALASGVIVALVLALGACSSSAKPTTVASGGSSLTPAGRNPSASAKMVCATEAQTELAASLGVKAVSVTTPTWSDHVYSCTYIYPTGRLTLSVKELSSTAQTTAYFNAQGSKLGRRPGVIGIGQGGFQTTNGDVVVRKDWKVLTVDVSKLPAKFGNPIGTPASAGLSVSATILGCWTGT